MQTNLIVVLCLAISLNAVAQSKPAPLAGKAAPEASASDIGKAAPPVSVATWLDGKDAFVVGKGRACMLVFWAPWCGSCVAEFPRVNELIEQVGDLPVTFVAIADDPREKVEALLAKRPLHSRVALDNKSATFEAYHVKVVPRIVLIDASGAIAAMPRIEDVNVDVLRKLVKGDVLALAVQHMEPADLEWDTKLGGFDPDLSLSHVLIERSTSAGGGVKFPPNHGRITGDGMGFGNLIQVAFGAESHEVQSTHPEYKGSEKRYRISIKAPDDKAETARAMLREQIERILAFRAEWIETEAAQPVLRCVPGKDHGALKPSTAAKPDGFAHGGAITYTKVKIAEIVKSLGMFGYGTGMIDETGLQGEFDLKLEWTPGDRESFDKALGGCGLVCTMEARKVRRLRVTPAE